MSVKVPDQDRPQLSRRLLWPLPDCVAFLLRHPERIVQHPLLGAFHCFEPGHLNSSTRGVLLLHQLNCRASVCVCDALQAATLRTTIM